MRHMLFLFKRFEWWVFGIVRIHKEGVRDNVSSFRCEYHPMCDRSIPSHCNIFILVTRFCIGSIVGYTLSTYNCPINSCRACLLEFWTGVWCDTSLDISQDICSQFAPFWLSRSTAEVLAQSYRWLSIFYSSNTASASMSQPLIWLEFGSSCISSQTCSHGLAATVVSCYHLPVPWIVAVLTSLPSLVPLVGNDLLGRVGLGYFWNSERVRQHDHHQCHTITFYHSRFRHDISLNFYEWWIIADYCST